MSKELPATRKQGELARRVASYMFPVVSGGAGLGTLIAWWLTDPAAWAPPLTAVALLALSQLDKFKEFSFGMGGLKLVREAEQKLDAMQKLAKVFAEQTLHSQESLGRFGGGRGPDKERLRLGVLDLLREVGVEEDEVRRIYEPAARYVDFDYRNFLTHQLDDPPTQLFHELRELHDAEEMRRAIDAAGLLNDNVDAAVSDYAYWQEHRQHRRPQVHGQPDWPDVKATTSTE